MRSRDMQRLLKFHYISVLEQANTKALDAEKEMNDICSSAGSESEKSSLQNKCVELITKTNQCCEDKAKELKDKSRKRDPDLNDGQTAPDPKRPRIAETVLNNTQDRDTAILGLIKAVNEVCNKPSQPHSCPRTKGTEAEEKAAAAEEEREEAISHREKEDKKEKTQTIL